MRTLLQPRYVIGLVALVAATYLWGASTLDSAKQRHRREVVRMGSGLARGLTILADTLPADQRDQRLGAMMSERLSFRRPLRRVELRRDNRLVASVTNPAPQRTAGPVVEARFILEGEKDPAYWQQGRPGKPPWLWNGDPTGRQHTRLELIVALDPELPPDRERDVYQRILSMSLLAWLLVGAVAWAWARSLASRDMARRLERDRAELSRLTDLNLAASGLAHETKNPLGIIRGVAQRMARAADASQRTRDGAEIILEEADRAASRLGDFINFAQLPAPNWGSVQPGQVIARLVEVLGADFEAAGVGLSWESAEAHTRCDRAMLEQVLVNLLLNSLQACSAATPPTSVHVSFSIEDGLGLMRVDDTGAGMNEDLVAAAFRPYVTGRADGHGLGLAVVKRICEQHGWTVGLQSTPGVGTTVTIEGLSMHTANVEEA